MPPLLFGALVAAACMAGIVAGARAQNATDEEVEFVPRTDAPPAKRVGAGTRNPNGVPLRIIGFAPRQTLGYTLREQPTLYFSLSRETAKPIEVAVNDLGDPEKPAVAELVLDKGHPAGLLRLDFSAMKTRAGEPLRLGENRRYEVVLLTTESAEGSANNSAVFSIQRLAADPAAAVPAEPARAAAWFARKGLWFDCVDALNRAIAKQPKHAPLIRSREKLLGAEGLVMAENGIVTERQPSPGGEK